ncbi:hypothetical protein PsYK624_170450 [Phanerochaete sordida]|uniref:Uncharacterized protein n=1 Tax=Phanerochaete sordida TaxID=48140 RepID=A0A9P3GYM7_9APHY|nr:hypothetical protein PsYK624_170450 [Phanerochaete sordida]
MQRHNERLHRGSRQLIGRDRPSKIHSARQQMKSSVVRRAATVPRTFEETSGDVLNATDNINVRLPGSDLAALLPSTALSGDIGKETTSPSNEARYSSGYDADPEDEATTSSSSEVVQHFRSVHLYVRRMRPNRRNLSYTPREVVEALLSEEKLITITMEDFAKLWTRCVHCDHIIVCGTEDEHRCGAGRHRASTWARLLGTGKPGLPDAQLRDIFALCTSCDRVRFIDLTRSCPHLCRVNVADDE